tara:strand:+ start:1413 stop:2447 length:1035 start_codon:yes stop_codon:yes gene_type:complete
MDLNNFRKNLINKYNKFDEFKEVALNFNKKELSFLYLHLNNINISFIPIDTYLIKTNIKYDSNFYESFKIIYGEYLTIKEKKILNESNNLSIYCFKNKDGSFDKDRRDFLIPCFFHLGTINFLKKIYDIKNEGYGKSLIKFHIILDNIRKYIKAKNRLGVIFCSSFSMNTYNIRKSKDLDVVILHPYYHSNKIKKRFYLLAKLNKLIDLHAHGIYEWKDINKNNMYMIDKIISKKKINFYHLIFNQEYHHYFFGVKVIDIEYDIKYRATRSYPKNIADLILIKKKININIPKIKKLSNNIKIDIGNNKFKIYDKPTFFLIVQKYLKKNKLDLSILDIKKFISNK